MANLTLEFAYHAGQIQLEKTIFTFSSNIEFTAVRGKTSGAYRSTGSFQWTPAVKAVCVLFLQSLVCGSVEPRTTGPLMSGRRGSLASSLDYAIDKEPQWLCDMFGLDQSGKTNLRRLVSRTNPGGKRPGPVSLSLNESILPTDNIVVLLDSMPIHDPFIIDRIIAFLSNEPPEPNTASQGSSEPLSFLNAKVERYTLRKRSEDPIVELRPLVHCSCMEKALVLGQELALPTAI
jgi:hypothetical protein